MSPWLARALVLAVLAWGPLTASVRAQAGQTDAAVPPPTSVPLAPEDEAVIEGFEPSPVHAHGRGSIAPLPEDPREHPPSPTIGPFPVRVPDRPLTLPSWWLQASMGFAFAPGRVCVQAVPGVTECETRETTHLTMTGLYGFSRWLTVESRVAARLFPDAQGDTFSFRFRIRGIDRGGQRLVFDLAYGQTVAASGPVNRRLEIGPYAALRVSPRLRFRLGFDVGLASIDGASHWALGAPFAIDLAPIPRLYLRLETRASLVGRAGSREVAWETPGALELGGVLAVGDGRPVVEVFGRGELGTLGPAVSLDRLTDRWSFQFGFRFLRAQLPPAWRLARQARAR